MNSFVEWWRARGHLVASAGLLLNFWAVRHGGVGLDTGSALLWTGMLAHSTLGIEGNPGLRGLVGFGWAFSVIASIFLGWASLERLARVQDIDGLSLDLWISTLVVMTFTMFLAVLLRRLRLKDLKRELPEL